MRVAMSSRKSDDVRLRFRDATAKDIAAVAALLNATSGALTARFGEGRWSSITSERSVELSLRRPASELRERGRTGERLQQLVRDRADDELAPRGAVRDDRAAFAIARAHEIRRSDVPHRRRLLATLAAHGGERVHVSGHPVASTDGPHARAPGARR